MSKSFSRAIVVGASSGIGEALAVQLGAARAHVVLVSRRGEALEKVAEAVRAAGGQATVLVHDVREHAAAGAQFETALAALGGLDLLVYAAGLLERVQEGEFDASKDTRMLEVNLLGAVAWSDAAAAHFQAQRSGTLVGISSVAGVRGRRGNPVYGASKAGLTAYYEALRNRLSRYGVNVVTIKPGYVDTQMTQGQPGLFWLVSAEEAGRQILAIASRGGSPDAFVPARWGLVAAVLKTIPSVVFRRLNF
jgi:NAD(P)-dependent dehydrogenase (short-subunit alcohol dehydrogenase family)